MPEVVFLFGLERNETQEWTKMRMPNYEYSLRQRKGSSHTQCETFENLGAISCQYEVLCHQQLGTSKKAETDNPQNH
jgi:hypothetical protein